MGVSEESQGAVAGSFMKFPLGPDAFRNATGEISVRPNKTAYVFMGTVSPLAGGRHSHPQQDLAPCPRSSQAPDHGPLPTTTW